MKTKLRHIVMAAALTALSCQTSVGPEIEKEEEIPDWNSLEKIDTNKSGKTDVEILNQFQGVAQACLQPDLDSTIHCIAEELKNPDYASREITAKIATAMVDGERISTGNGGIWMDWYADGNNPSQTAYKTVTVDAGDGWFIEEFKVSKLEIGRDPRYVNQPKDVYDNHVSYFLNEGPNGDEPAHFGPSHIIETFNH